MQPRDQRVGYIEHHVGDPAFDTVQQWQTTVVEHLGQKCATQAVLLNWRDERIEVRPPRLL